MKTSLSVKLLRHTENPELLVALSARLCYSRDSIDDLLGKTEKQRQDAFLRGVMESGHLSVLEHASFTFAIEGVSRVLLAQITRHRIASFSVQSQRYVSSEEGFSYIVPPAIEALGEEAVRTYEEQMRIMHGFYVSWQEKLGKTGEASNEDARFVLPGAAETRMVLTMNARELLHFFALRCCNRAQWEIRALAKKMLSCVYPAAPVLFEKAGPGCISGVCPEGKRSCGQQAAVKEIFCEMKKRR